MKLCAMIKRSEQVLYNKLQNLKSDEPLKNVKNSLGSLRYAKGNPLTKTEISLQVTSFFFTAALVPMLPAALPIFQQNALPVYLFSLTDYYGNFGAMRNVVPSNPAWNLGLVGIVGYNIVPFAGVGQPGDLLINYVAAAPAPNDNVALIVVHCNNVAYGTFLNSFVSDLITISVLRAIVPLPNINQYVNPFVIGTQSLFGKVHVDSIDPRQYIIPTDFQQEIADMPLNLPIDKSLLFGYQLDVFCQQMSFILFVQKVESLINKRYA